MPRKEARTAKEVIAKPVSCAPLMKIDLPMKLSIRSSRLNIILVAKQVNVKNDIGKKDAKITQSEPITR